MGMKEKVFNSRVGQGLAGLTVLFATSCSQEQYPVDGKGHLSNCHFQNSATEAEFEQAYSLIDEMEEQGRFRRVTDFRADHDSTLSVPYHPGVALKLEKLGPNWGTTSKGLFKQGDTAHVTVEEAVADNGTTIRKVEMSKFWGGQELAFIVATEDAYEVFSERHPDGSFDWNVKMVSAQGDPTPDGP